MRVGTCFFGSYDFYLYYYKRFPLTAVTVICGAKLYQYAKNATFAPHFQFNFNKTWKKTFTSIRIIFS